MTIQRLAGCFTAIITPFTESGELDINRLRQQVQFQVEGGVAGLVPCGTTGESPTLSAREWEKVVQTTVETVKTTKVGNSAGATPATNNKVVVIAGTGSNSTAHAVQLQKQAQQLGADAGLSVNPYYNKPTQQGLYRHFMSVADAADLAVVLYNIPGRTGVALTPETIQKLAQHPNIIAVKEATGSTDSACEIIHRCANVYNFVLLSGDDTMTLPFAALGASGVVSVLSNLIPSRVQALCDAFNNNNWLEARAIHYKNFPLAKGLLSLATNPIPIKTAMMLLSRDVGTLRLPLTSAEEEDKANNTQIINTIKTLLTNAELL